MAKDKETVKETEEVRISPRTGKPMKKPRGGNSPCIGMNGYNLEEGDNNKFVSMQMELFNLPNIDMSNVEEVAERLNEYFAIYAKRDTKPTVAGMAIALNGHNRKWLYAVTHDIPTGGAGYKAALPSEVADLIKRAYFLLENLWETYMVSGKINPVAGIFLAKNNYQYEDKVEHIVTPNTNQESDFSAEDIKQRYLTDGEDGET